MEAVSPRAQIETNSLGTLVADLAISDHLSLLPQAYIRADDHSTLATVNVLVPHAKRIVGMTIRRDWLPTIFQSELVKRIRATGPQATKSIRS